MYWILFLPLTALCPPNNGTIMLKSLRHWAVEFSSSLTRLTVLVLAFWPKQFASLQLPMGIDRNEGIEPSVTEMAK